MHRDASEYVFFTSDLENAQGYAEDAAARKGTSAPRVYLVKPTGTHEADPEYDDEMADQYRRSRHPLRIIREVQSGHRTASAWTPQVGIFGPTTGLDHRLFNDQFRLRPEVRGAIMERLDRCIRTDAGLAGSDWQDWTRVYLLGGSVSEWAGSRPNEAAQDLDVIVAVDLAGAQRHNAFEGMSGGQAASALNTAFRKHFNEDGWQAPFGGQWDLTAFCNQRAWDITVIKPYAAWDLTHGAWAVTPPHLPEHTLADFSPAVLAQARAVAAEARAILRMDEPLRTREARALWDRIHAGRSMAFSEQGTGWDDPANVTEKWLAYAPRDLLGKIRELALGSSSNTAFLGNVVAMTKAASDQGIVYSHKEDPYRPGVHRFDAHDENGRNVGYAQAYERPGHVFLDAVYVTPDVRRHGVGSRLLDDAVGHFPGREIRLKPEPFGYPDPPGPDEPRLRDLYRRRGFEDYQHSPEDEASGHMIRHASAAFRLPESEIGPLYHGTTEDRARQILESGFKGGEGRHEGIVHLAPTPELAHSFAEGRVKADGRGTPTVLRIEKVRGVSAEETGYSSPALNRDAGAHYMPGYGEVLVLDPSAIHGVSRHELAFAKTASGPGREVSFTYVPATGSGTHAITVHPRGAELTKENRVGRLSWTDEPGGSRIVNLWVHPDYQRHGIATEMHRQAREISPELRHAANPTEAGQAWISGMQAKTAAANPPCHYCGEPLDDEDVRDQVSSHDECQEMRWCEAHQDHHDDPAEAEDHNSTYTDWSEHLPFEHGIHRGLTVRLPEAAHQAVHDPARPLADRARELGSRLHEDHGVHWTDRLPIAQAWGTGEGALFSGVDPKDPAHTHVVLHAASPAEEHIEDNPEELSRRNLWGFGHDRSEREIPLKAGVPVHLTGVSWKRGGESEWNRHDFADGSSHTATRDSSGSEKHGVYLRFGHWPENERSINHVTGWREDGVSAYDLDHHGEPKDPDPRGERGYHDHGGWCDEGCDIPEFDEEYGNDTSEEMRGRINRAERNRRQGGDRPDDTAHLVRGDMVGLGHDEEPLLKNVRRVGDWIDHRHLFMPGAKPHRLARSPEDEDYEPPEEAPPGHRTAVRTTIDLYHRTQPEYASQIMSGGFEAEPDEDGEGPHVYFSDRCHDAGRETVSYGPSIIHVRVPRHYAHEETGYDLPGGEAHYRVPLHLLGPEHIVGLKSGAVQKTGRQLGPWQQWTKDRPHKAVINRAQESFRAANPDLTGPLDERDWDHPPDRARESEAGRKKLLGMLYEGHHPRAHDAWVMPHNQPGRGVSQVAVDQNTGAPGVVLHPDRWDAVTLAHEAAHLVDAHRRGVDLAGFKGADGDQVSTGIPDEEMHGPEFARHYANALDTLRHGAGDDFLRHHAAAVKLVGNQRYRVHGEPREFGGLGPSGPGRPQMPPRQEALHDPSLDYRDYREKGLELAKNPDPGTVLWRSEHLPAGEDHSSPESVGMHWSVKPEQVIHMPDRHGLHTVVYQARLHDPGSQAIPRSHPMWSGRHESMPSEAEVRLHPGGSVHVEGLWVPGRTSEEGRGPLRTLSPHRMRPGDWNWHPVGRDVPVRYRGQGATDYSDVGIHREAAAEDRGANWVDDARKTISDMAAKKGHQLTWTADETDERRPYRTNWWRAACGNCGEPSGRPPQRAKKEVVLPQDPAENADHWLGDNERLPHWLTTKCSQGRPRKPGPKPAPVPRTPRQVHEAATGYTDLGGRTAMIYLYIPPGLVEPHPGGVDDQHITLVYLGKNVSDAAWTEACRRAEKAAAQCAPMDGVLRGIDIFPPSPSSDGKVPVFVPAYIAGVGRLRRELEDLSASEHKDFRPHLSLAYLEEGDSLPAERPAVSVRFTRLYVKRGDEILSYPLGGRLSAQGSRPGFYHGSYHDMAPGDELTPDGANETGRRYLGSGQKHVFYTGDMGLARAYGPKVYRVQPLAPPSGRGRDQKRLHDPEPGFPREHEYLSSRGFRVLERVDDDEAKQAWDDRAAARWKSRGGQETIQRIVDRDGPDGLPESARPHYRPLR